MKKLIVILIWVVILGISFINVTPSLSQINKIAGGLLVVSIFLWVRMSRKSIYLRSIFTIEMRLFALFIGTSLVFGVLNASDQETVMSDIRLLTQIWLLAAGVIISILINENVSHVFYLLFMVPLLQCTYIGLTYGWRVLLNFSDSRLTLETMNPNTFGNYMLYGIFGLLYIFFNSKNLLLRWSCLLPLPLFLMGLFQSGSRKSLIAAIITVLAWLLLCYLPTLKGGYVTRGLKYISILSIVVLSTLYLSTEIVPQSTVGVRMTYLLNDPESVSGVRLQLYKDSFSIFMNNPVFGVGLGNFRYNTDIQMYAHSDYAEILADTGILGTLLYFSIFFLLWRKMDNLARTYQRIANVSYIANLFKVGIIFLLVLGLGRPNYNNVLVWVVLSGAMGYYAYISAKFPVKHDIRVLNKTVKGLAVTG